MTTYKVYPPLPDRISWGQDYLLRLIEKRQLKAWTDEYGPAYTAIHRIAFGLRTPSYRDFFLMREVIPVCFWFSYTDEKKPRKKKFTARVSEPIVKKSLGFKILQDFNLDWCKKNDISNTVVYPLRIAKTKPCFTNIQLLKPFVHPDLWFIFEGEEE